MGEGLSRWLRGGGMSRQEKRLSDREERALRDDGGGNLVPQYDNKTKVEGAWHEGEGGIKLGGSDVRPRRESFAKTGPKVRHSEGGNVVHVEDLHRKADSGQSGDTNSLRGGGDRKSVV